MPVPARLTATLRVSPGSTVKVSTSQGAFAFRPSRLGYGVESSFLGGRVTMSRAPVSARLTDTATDDGQWFVVAASWLQGKFTPASDSPWPCNTPLVAVRLSAGWS